MPDAAKIPIEPTLAARVAQLQAHREFVDGLCEQVELGAFGLVPGSFIGHLARSVGSRFKGQTPGSPELESYLSALHLADFALACGCAEGCEAAWNIFVRRYRGYLRACAAAMLKRASDASEAVELADSLFAELYGLADGRRGAGSLFRYFHGRSSLKTWLRAVLAQRHVDSIRAARRFDSLDEQDGAGRAAEVDSSNVLGLRERNLAGPLSAPPDPYRDKYIALFCAALRVAMEKLVPADRQRVVLYYAEGQTLAEVGRLCGEHESSASRNLERIRRDLRAQVEDSLRRGAAEGAASGGETVVGLQGLSDAQIALCFQYATEDAPIDFALLFPRSAGENAKPGTRRGPGRQDS